MSRLSSPYGWLLYAGSFGATPMAVSGDCVSGEITSGGMYFPGGLRVTAELAPGTVRTPPEGQQLSLENLMGAALASWPQPGKKNGRRWPPQIRALIALAGRYPEEYEKLLEAEAGPAALRVVRDPWVTG